MRRTVKVVDNYKLGLASKKSRYRFDVIKKRQDGVEWSVGTAANKHDAEIIKKKQSWKKTDPAGKLLHHRR